MNKFNYKGYNVKVVVAKYAENNNTCLSLVDLEDNSPVAKITVNLSNDLPDDQAFIKSWSENIGMLDWCVKQGIVTEVIDVVKQGYVSIPLCKLNLNII